jgi:hypothetical protein
MSDFHDWEGVLGTQGFRAALLAYGRANGEIKPNGRLPKDDLEYMASAAIRSGDEEFALEDRQADRGSTYVHCFAGYYWSYSYGGIDGPFDDLEEAVDTILSIASSSAPEGFYTKATGALDDGFIASRCVEFVRMGKTFIINDKVYIRTKDGLVLKA